eukprot:TRINITY_DN71602_c0_g1_i1.p1 TRINITY_DN71602_c0_g1~~TRINITY_DN71602_c0_g1_i1.p1  ORF type:complete len:216 (+),score=19.90 TRINITY_DN71602_c0_g1_i1:51-650(+)
MISGLQTIGFDLDQTATRSNSGPLHDVVLHEKDDAPFDGDDHQVLVNSRGIEPVTRAGCLQMVESDAQPSSSSPLPLTTILRQYGMPSSPLPSHSPEGTSTFRDTLWEKAVQGDSALNDGSMPTSSLPSTPSGGSWVFHETLWGKPFQLGSADANQQSSALALDTKKSRSRRRRRRGSYSGAPEHEWDAFDDSHEFRLQ